MEQSLQKIIFECKLNLLRYILDYNSGPILDDIIKKYLNNNKVISSTIRELQHLKYKFPEMKNVTNSEYYKDDDIIVYDLNNSKFFVSSSIENIIILIDFKNNIGEWLIITQQFKLLDNLGYDKINLKKELQNNFNEILCDLYPKLLIEKISDHFISDIENKGLSGVFNPLGYDWVYEMYKSSTEFIFTRSSSF